MFDDLFGAKWCSYTFSVANASKHSVFLGLSQRIKLSLSLWWWFLGFPAICDHFMSFFAGIHFINCSKLHLPHPGRLPWRCAKDKDFGAWGDGCNVFQSNRTKTDTFWTMFWNTFWIFEISNGPYWPHWSHIKLHELKTSGFGRCLPMKFSVNIISLEIWQDIQTAKELSIRNIMIKYDRYLWHTLIFKPNPYLGPLKQPPHAATSPPSPGSTGLPQPLQRAQHLPPLPSG